jgi:hypothetical protein
MQLKDIRPAEYNPRVELKPGDKEYEDLKNSIERFGLVEPLVWNRTTKTLVSGHQRLNVLLAQGETEAEVVVIEKDEEHEKIANIALNKIEGDWEYEALKELFEEMSPEDIKFTGFSSEELQNLFDMGEPDFGETEDGEEQESAGGAAQDQQEEAEENEEFTIFLSFPTKEKAEEWLEEREIEARYEGASRNITVRMEGLDYGAGN